MRFGFGNRGVSKFFVFGIGLVIILSAATFAYFQNADALTTILSPLATTPTIPGLNQWTNVGGTGSDPKVNAVLIQEILPTPDKYIKNTHDDLHQTYIFAPAGLTNPSTGYAVKDVTVKIIAKKIGSKTGKLDIIAAKGSRDNEGESSSYLTTSYAEYKRVMKTNPFTGQPWTLSEVNTWKSADNQQLTFGVEQDSESVELDVTKMSVEVNSVTIAFDNFDPLAGQSIYTCSADGCEQSVLTVTDPYATSSSIKVHVTSGADPLGIDVMLQAISPGSKEFNNNNKFLNFVTGPSSQSAVALKVTSALGVVTGDKVTAKYNGASKIASVNPASSGGFHGSPPPTTNAIRFAESDLYTNAQAATLKVTDSASTALTTILVHVKSSVSDTGGFDVTLNQDSAGASTFTSPRLVTFSTTASVPASNILKAGIGETVTATFKTFTPATATIIADPGVLTGTGYSPDITVRSTCVNDVDTDGDGLCDKWEDQSAHPGTIFIPASLTASAGNPGADYTITCTVGNTYTTDPTGATVCPDKTRKDVYVEIDHMKNHVVSTAAIAQVVTTFGAAPVRGVTGGAVNGIALHIFNDEDMGVHYTTLKYSSPVPTDVTYLTLKKQFFGTLAERTAPAVPPLGATQLQYVTDILTAKRQFFHYMEFIHDDFDHPQTSGYGETPGNDIAISLGEFTGHVGTTGQQAGTLMHEIGHNLGLKHGGADDVNCKPNYPSVMNYALQFDAADGGAATRSLDFSRVKYSSINEAALSETVASMTGTPVRNTVIAGIIGGTPLTPLQVATGTLVDWNHNGATAGTYSQNVRYNVVAGCSTAGLDDNIQTLTSNADWGPALVFNTRGQSTFDTGVSNPPDPKGTQSTAGTGDPDSLKPIVNAGGDGAIDEGTTFSSTATSDDPDSTTDTAVIHWGDTTSDTTIGPTSVGVTGIVSFPLSHVYADEGIYTMKVTVTNNRGGVDFATAIVTVNEKAPDVTAPAGDTIPEGTSYAGGAGSFIDPANDAAWTGTVNYGDGTGDQVLALSPTKTFTVLPHTYTDEGSFTVTVTVKDDHGTAGTATATVIVNEKAPDVTAPAGDSIDEGTSYAGGAGSFTDPANDGPWTATVNYGDGPNQVLALSPTKTFTVPSHVYTDEGSFTVTVTVKDDHGTAGVGLAAVIVNEKAPDVTPPSGDTIDEGTSYAGGPGFFTDPANDATWTGTVNYGDGTGDQVLTLNPDKTFTVPSHVYTDEGNNLVKVTVKDDHGTIGTAISDVMVLVNEKAPVVSAPDGDTIPEGTSYGGGGGSFIDPAVDGPWTATVNYGDGPDQVLALNLDKTFTVLPHTYTDEGTFLVTVTVKDKVATPGTADASVLVYEKDPDVTPPAGDSIDEGTSYAGGAGSFTDPANDGPWTATVNYGDGPNQVLTLNPDKTFTVLPHTYTDEGTFMVRVTVTDNEGRPGTADASVLVNEKAPDVTAPAGDSIDEGTSYAGGAGSFTDPANDGPWTGTVNYGDGTPDQVLLLNPDKTFTVPSHVYADNPPADCECDSFQVTVTVRDYVGTVGTAITDVMVNNVDPDVTAVNDQTIDEGDNLALVGGEGSPYAATFTDPGTADTHTATIDWGDGTTPEAATVTEPIGINPGHVTGSHTYVDNPTDCVECNYFTATVTVTDKDNGVSSDTFRVHVNNVAPVVTAAEDQDVSASSGSLDLSGPPFAATFTDPGTDDTHTATIDWGDDSSLDDGTVTEPTVSDPGTVAGSHTYTANNDYLVTITVTDKDNGVSSSSFTSHVTGIPCVEC